MGVSKCLLQWHAWSQTQVSQRRLSSKAVAHFQKIRDFQSWSTTVAIFAEWSALASQSRRHGTIIRRVIARVHQVYLLDTFAGWQTCTLQRRRARAVVYRLESSSQKRELSWCFDQWQDEVQLAVSRECSSFDVALDDWKIDRVLSEHKESVATMTDRFEILHNRLVAMHRKLRVVRELSGCFKAWRARANSDRSRRTRVAEAVTRIEDVAYGTVFDGWVAWLWEEQARRALYDRTVRRLRRVNLTSALKSWHRKAHNSRKLRIATQRTIHRILHLRRRATFATWTLFVAKARRVRKFAKRLNLMSMASSFERWVAASAVWRTEAAQAAAQATAQVLRVQHDATLAAMRVDFAASQDRASQRMQDSRAKTTRTRCFVELKGYTQFRKQRREAVAAAVRRIQHLAITQWFDGWQIWVHSRQNMKRLHERARAKRKF